MKKLKKSYSREPKYTLYISKANDKVYAQAFKAFVFTNFAMSESSLDKYII